MALLREEPAKAKGRRSWGISPKEISLVTGNVIETIYQVLSLVGPVFARADDSLMPPKSFSLPLCSQPWWCIQTGDLSREKTVPERTGGPDALLLSPSTCLLSLYPPNVCACTHTRMKGEENKFRWGKWVSRAKAWSGRGSAEGSPGRRQGTGGTGCGL